VVISSGITDEQTILVCLQKSEGAVLQFTKHWVKVEHGQLQEEFNPSLRD
jgi:hypothetical protein